MQALSDGRLVCIEQPELLEHIFLLAHDRDTQAALLRTSKAWAAVGKRCSPLEAEVHLAGGACWPLGKRWGFPRMEPEQLPSGGMAGAAAWLVQRRRLASQLELRLGNSRQRWYQESAEEEDLETVGAKARMVLQAMPGLASLTTRSLFDIQWLPLLPALTSLSLDFAGGTGPLDCIAPAAPQLRHLELAAYSQAEYAPAFLSPAASLPPGLTSLRSDGLADGFGPHLSQLVSLGWQPMERRSWVSFPGDMIAGLSQATRLTRLWLVGPHPSDIPAFFDSLACGTALRSLSIGAAPEDVNTTLLSPEYYRDADDYAFVLEALLPDALAELTALTHVHLGGHNMPVCPESLAYLPALKRLELSFNTGLTELPHGPWPALEWLQVDYAVVQAALSDLPAEGSAGGEAAAAEAAASGQGAGDTDAAVEPESAHGPCHALWSLTRLTALGDLWLSSWTGEEAEETKRTIRRLLPQLVRIS